MPFKQKKTQFFLEIIYSIDNLKKIDKGKFHESNCYKNSFK